MGTDKPTGEQQGQHAEAVQHIAEAHRILDKLKHEMQPASLEAIAEAMQKLEMALALLSVKTGGWL